MAVALNRPDHVALRLGSTLDRPGGPRHPMRAAARTAILVLLATAGVVAVLRTGSEIMGILDTLVFGIGAIVYALADFGAELPPLSSEPLEGGDPLDG